MMPVQCYVVLKEGKSFNMKQQNMNEGTQHSVVHLRQTASNPYAWRVKDITMASVLGVACGCIFWSFNIAYSWLSPLLGSILPGLASVLHAFWYFSGPLSLLIVRKPGTAIVVNSVGAAVEMLIGNRYSFTSIIIAALIEGIASELPFLITKYRKGTLPVSIISGGLTALVYGAYLVAFYYQGVAWLSPRGIIHMCSEFVGGILIAGVMSWLLYRAIVLTGAIESFSAGRDPIKQS